MSLRNKLVTAKNNKLNDWELETPKEIRAHSVKDVCKAYKSAISNLKAGHIKYFKLNFKSKKKKEDSIGIQKQSIKYKNGLCSIYTKSLGNLKIGKRNKKKYKDLEINYDCRLSYNGLYYYLCIPVKSKKIEKQETNKVIALDPGTRTFITGYSPQGELKEYKRNDNIINKLRNKISKLQSIRKNKKIKKLNNKVKNQIDDLHWKTINDLVNNYDKVLLPEFESQKLMSKNKHLNKELNNLAHFKFKERLKYKIKNIKSTELYIVTEEYTSKTCTNCGNIKSDLKSNKIYKCEKCKLEIDRDINGARNIILKYLL
jgi:putative transposase